LSIRGVRALPAVAVPVLERGMEEAVTLAESMDERGHGRGRRSRYRPQPWSGGAFAVAASAIAIGVLFLSASFGRWAVLNPSTAPLTWPDAQPLLVAALAALALPGVLVRGERR
jgi:hypothetical protein